MLRTGPGALELQLASEASEQRFGGRGLRPERELVFGSSLVPLRRAHQPNGIQATLPNRVLGGLWLNSGECRWRGRVFST